MNRLDRLLYIKELEHGQMLVEAILSEGRDLHETLVTTKASHMLEHDLLAEQEASLLNKRGQVLVLVITQDVSEDVPTRAEA